MYILEAKINGKWTTDVPNSWRHDTSWFSEFIAKRELRWRRRYMPDFQWRIEHTSTGVPLAA